MKIFFVITICVFMYGAADLQAERASVAVAKATVTAAKAVATATAKATKTAVTICPGRAVWRGVVWVVKHA